VLAILSVTSEWSQRTALVTFSLVPDRRRVLAAKLVAVVVLAVAVMALGARSPLRSGPSGGAATAAGRSVSRRWARPSSPRRPG
jgi:hypothetical protein